MSDDYFTNSIVIQVNTPDEFFTLREYFNNPRKLVDSHVPTLPMYVRSNFDRTEVTGRQSGVFDAGQEFIDRYNRGMSVTDFLSMNSLTDFYKPIVEYW